MDFPFIIFVFFEKVFPGRVAGPSDALIRIWEVCKRVLFSVEPRRALCVLHTAAFSLLFIFLSPSVYAEPFLARDLHESVVRVPVVVKDAFGERHLSLETTVYKPDGDGPFPLLILSHGTPPFGKRRYMERTRYLEQSREFIKLGFVVAIPMRRGYGNSDGNPVMEKCTDAPHHEIGLGEAKDLLATVEYMKREPYVDGTRIVLAGQSGGGFASIACSGIGFEGLVAVVNFAGGRGSMQNAGVCSENELISAYGKYGKTSRVPTLWLYTQNDLYFPPRLAKEMYEAFVKPGGQAKMVLLPPFEHNGHFLFSSNNGIPIWLPEVKNFLKPLLPIRD